MVDEYRVFSEEEKFLKKVVSLESDLQRELSRAGHGVCAGTGFCPYSQMDFLEVIRSPNEKSSDSEKPIFLDLGSGLGGKVAIASHFGHRAYGIELNSVLVKMGKNKLIRKLKRDRSLEQGSICRIAQGSYFPQEYVDMRESGDSVAMWFEQNDKGIRTFDKGKTRSDLMGLGKIFHPEASPEDPYTQLGIGLEDVDVFFGYLWEVQIPSVLEIFSRYAKEDAVLYFDAPVQLAKMNKLSRELGLKVNRPFYVNQVTKKKVRNQRQVK